jgi:hypothetical protein
MKMAKTIAAMLLIAFAWSFNGTAQTVQYVTLSTSNNLGVNFPIQSNQVVSVVGYDWEHVNYVQISGNLANGSSIRLTPYNAQNLGSTTIGMAQIPQTVTGLTNITLLSGNNSSLVWATFQITTPASANVVSNYIPADAIVIPTSATGNVQIILESSADLVNWTAANPGIYGPSSATNRFFRARAVLLN